MALANYIQNTAHTGFPPANPWRKSYAKLRKKKSYNNVSPNSEETLVPILAIELAKWNNQAIRDGLIKAGDLLDKENLETWHLGGRKILVGFVPVPKMQAETMIKAFWDDVNEYIESTRKKDVSLLTKMMSLFAVQSVMIAICAIIKIILKISLLALYL